MGPVVDSHLHVWRPMQGEFPPSTLVPPSEDVPIERAQAVFDRHGVGRSVLVQPFFRGEDNSYVAECAARDPSRVASVCVVDPRIGGAEDRLESWVVKHGCRGLRLRPRFPDESAIFGDPRTFPLWERARSLKIVVSILANPEHLATIGALAGRFPEVPMIIDHLAHPHVAEGVKGASFQSLLKLADQPNVYVKVSGYYHFAGEPDPYRNCWDLVHAVFDRFRPERLLWGSDFPHVERAGGYTRALELVQHDLPFLDDAARQAILSGTATRLYWPAG